MIRKELEYVDEHREIGKEDFLRKYKKSKISSLFDTDMEINIAKELNRRFKLKIYSKIISLTGGYEEFICNLLEYPVENIKSANQEYQKLQAKDVLKKYAGRKLIKDEQKYFIQEPHGW